MRSVEADSPAAGAGFVAGDVIVRVAGAPVQDPADIRRELHGAAASVEVGVTRNRRAVKLTLEKQDPAGA